MRLLAGLLVVALAAGGCGTGDDDVDLADDRDPGAALEAQRTEVRKAAAALVAGAVSALDGRSSETTGRFQGCESTFDEQFASFQYRAGGRVDAGPAATRPYLDALEAVLTGAGFDGPAAGERPGGRTLEAAKGELTAAFSELPGQGDYVLLTVEGPCVEVPEDERDAWLTRDDPSPYL